MRCHWLGWAGTQVVQPGALRTSEETRMLCLLQQSIKRPCRSHPREGVLSPRTLLQAGRRALFSSPDVQVARTANCAQGTIYVTQ